MTMDTSEKREPLNAVASKGACHPRFENGRMETVYDVTVDHPAGRWAQIWVLRDQALAERVADALNERPAPIKRSECKEHVLNCKEGMYDAMDTYFYEYIDWCPGCGAQIIE